MKQRRRGGRGRTLSGYSLNRLLLNGLKTGTVMQALKAMEIKGSHRGVKNLLGGRKILGVAREEYLFKALKKEGLTDKDIKKHLGELIREGHVYTPKRGFYKRT